MKRSITILSLLFLAAFSLVGTRTFAADSATPEIGKPIPDYTFTNVLYYRSKTLSLKDCRGKWLFLDFWSPHCKACIPSFPKANGFLKEFDKQINWVMVGYNVQNAQEDSKDVERIYEKFRLKGNLQMIAAFDTTLFHKWDVHGVPCIFVIDPQGILQYITSGFDLTRDKISGMINGDHVELALSETKPPFDPNSVITGNDPIKTGKLICHSLLVGWNGERPIIEQNVDDYLSRKNKEKGFRLAMANLFSIYKIAYLGQSWLKFPNDSVYAEIYPEPVLEMKDTSLFEYDYHEHGKGIYNYELLIPENKMSHEAIMTYIQQDLSRAFGYHVSIETRPMPVWKLVARPGVGEKIRTKGGESISFRGSTGSIYLAVRNVSVKTCITVLTDYLGGTERDPFIDGTGITSNIDLTLNADLTSIDDTRKALQEQGLDLVKDLKRMKVLVIRD